MPIWAASEFERYIADVGAVYQDAARGGIIKPWEQVGYGGLARAGRANERGKLPGLYRETQIVQGVARFALP